MSNISSETVFWIWRFIPTVAILFFLGLILFVFLGQEVDITEAETKILSNHLIYSCLVYNDGIRDIIGVVDMNKLSEENLKDCVSRQNLGYKVSLKNKEVYVMSADYRKWFDVCRTIKDFECTKNEEFVLVNQELKPEILTVEVIKNKQ